jgi:hypothetical protein
MNMGNIITENETLGYSGKLLVAVEKAKRKHVMLSRN